ncbi:hypothetical protein CC85DRAFT_285937 [Cutaneotrichosporon oleaginosum]|uniref:Uncharacterized protein n=1 Tax=Cutaneotrichosporon oleaginosum TaxID=879819 RepID=A0A0J0XLN1_9TREE|nr:uncharacterized protein CC85DRAFT_285937 [Cutaneotrichosporon oleaginosum]KLT42006.1 hypothetical protein CC85DRAFT_285937 [Cutaneotrichosporon oleaginosum]TXT14336.1 hypothetical protein COLE_00529 [Cutaneotrichosporon oleaginosum]
MPRPDAGWARSAPPAHSRGDLSLSSAVACFADGYHIDSPCTFTREPFVYAHCARPSFAQRLRALLPKALAPPPPYVPSWEELPSYEAYRLPTYREARRHGAVLAL